MYVHAYQSYIWNIVASVRMKLNPNEVLEGDLIYEDISESSTIQDLEDPDAGQEFSLTEDLPDEEQPRSVRAITAEEVLSGHYTIHDIVLPTPGYKVTYPSHPDVRQAYISTMAKDGLDPFNMRRNVKLV